MIKKPYNLDMYWADFKQEPDAFLSALDTKEREYYDDLKETGLLDVMERSYRAYYGGKVSGNVANTQLFYASALRSGGKSGEKTIVKVNHFRNLIEHVHHLVTSNKPVTQAKSANTDYKSQSQTMLANGLLDYYWREKNVERHVSDATETMLIYGLAFVHAPWNPSMGKETGADMQSGKTLHEGDQEYYVLAPMDAIGDPSIKNGKETWRILRGQENRWDLAARYPKHKDAILEASALDPLDDESPTFQLRGGNEPKNEDLVRIKTFYHAKTGAMPNGRLTIYLQDVILFDGYLPYDDIPVYKMCAKKIADTIYGYSMAFDLLGIQEGVDELNTALMSNNKTLALQSIWIKDTDKLNVSTLGGGMKVMKSEEKPESLQLTQSAPETYTYKDSLTSDMETISGVSATMRGNPEASLKSGAALALVVSQSVQFSSSVEESVYRLVEDLSMALIKNFRDFSTTNRVINIVGEANRSFAKEFDPKGELSQINRVLCERVNPMSKTIAGRVEIANNLLQQGMIENPKQYIMVLTTGQLDPVVEAREHKLLNIRAENEELRNGREVIAIATDNHADHIMEHATVLDSPEARRDPNIVSIVLAHQAEHIRLWRETDPAILMVTGQQPPPPPMIMPGMGAPMPNGAPPAEGQSPAAMQPQNPEVVNGVPVASMPDMPENTPPEAQASYDKML